MANILVFDTETTNLIPKSNIFANNMSQELLDTMPHIVTLSSISFDMNNIKLDKYEDDIIKIPKEVVISDENFAFHKLTQKCIQKKGISIESVIEKFMKDYDKADLVVGHNIYFDLEMLRIELARLIFKKDESCEKWTNYYRILMNSKSKRYCTCHNKITKNLCGKIPKLIELYKMLFNETPENLHTSLWDVNATLRCYVKIINDIDICKDGKNPLKDKIEIEKKLKKNGIDTRTIINPNHNRMLTRNLLRQFSVEMCIV